MNPFVAETGAGLVRERWLEHGPTTLRLAAACMLVAAAVWLSYQFWRLTWQAAPLGAVDLRILHGLVREWFAGTPVYRDLPHAMQPPATYAILWPALGWMGFTVARWLWASSTIAALSWLVYLVVRESRASTTLERAVAALMPLSMYATGAAIGNGQMIVHSLTLLLAGMLLLRQPSRRGFDLLAAGLVLASFVKPSISAPFFWIVLFCATSLRPATLVGLGYLALTCLAISFQDADAATLVQSWVARGSAIAVRPGDGNVANLHIWLAAAGLKEWILPASLAALAGVGLWVYCHRRVELWLLLGVSAYVARLWTYHRWYDDLLILLPMVSLFRIAKQGQPTTDGVMAGLLLAATMLAMLAPGGLFLLPEPWNERYVAGQLFLWFSGLIFLIKRAWQERGSAILAAPGDLYSTKTSKTAKIAVPES